MKLILASNSPRRKELLAGLGIPYDVLVIKGIDESYPDDLPANEVAEFIARKKAKAYEGQRSKVKSQRQNSSEKTSDLRPLTLYY